jgi:hypothetical protein
MMFEHQELGVNALFRTKKDTSANLNTALADLKSPPQSHDKDCKGASGWALVSMLGLFGRLYQLSFIEGATRKHSWHSWGRDDGRRSPSTLIVRAASEAVPEGEDFEELLKFMEKANLGDFQSKVLDWCQELG